MVGHGRESGIHATEVRVARLPRTAVEPLADRSGE
jgi:hypothetical protein